MPRHNKSKVYAKWWQIGRKLALAADDDAGLSQEQYVTEGTQRSMAVSNEQCIYRDRISNEELDASPLPAALKAEEYYLNKNNSNALLEFNSRIEEIRALIDNAKEEAEAAEREGKNLDIFLKKTKTRGNSKLYTKVDKDLRRVVLQWNENGEPYGPGDWPTKFTEVIGCLVRDSAYWNVAFSFTKNSFYAFMMTWKELLRYFYLEDDIDRRWVYVRSTTQQCFKQFRERIKRKYMKDPKFEEDWQRLYALPSTIPTESFAYLLLYWKGDRAKEESRRNSTNRKRKEENYYGGNVPAQRYRHAIDLAGGDASLSTTWQVLHTTDNMPEEALQTQREHWEHLAVEEQSFQDNHPEIPPEQSILPLEVEAAIMQREFPNAAAKGRLSIVGSYRSSTSSSRGSSAGGGFYYSQQAEEFRQLQQLYKEQTEAYKKLQEDYQVMSSRQQQYEQQQSRMMEQLAQLTARVVGSSSSLISDPLTDTRACPFELSATDAAAAISKLRRNTEMMEW